MKLCLQNGYPSPWPTDLSDDEITEYSADAACVTLTLDDVIHFEWKHVLTVQFKDDAALKAAVENTGWAYIGNATLVAPVSIEEGYQHPAIVVLTAPINPDGTLGDWTTAPPIPNALCYSQAIVTKNRVYLLGGLNSGNSSTIYTAEIGNQGQLVCKLNQPQGEPTMNNANQTTPTPAASSVGEDKNASQPTANLNAPQFNPQGDQVELARLEAMKHLASTVFNPAGIAGTYMAPPPMQPMYPQQGYPQMPPMGQMPGAIPSGNPHMNQRAPGVSQWYPGKQSGMFQQPGVPTQAGVFQQPPQGCYPPPQHPATLPQGSPWFQQQSDGANWLPPLSWPVNPLEMGKVVFLVEGLGLTFFEGKDIPGVCKVLSQSLPEPSRGGVVWSLCTTSARVRVLRFPPMTPTEHPGSWTQLLDLIKFPSQILSGSIAMGQPTISLGMEQLKTFVWAELPGLAKVLQDDVVTARGASSGDTVAAYFEAQRALAEENRKA